MIDIKRSCEKRCISTFHEFVELARYVEATFDKEIPERKLCCAFCKYAGRRKEGRIQEAFGEGCKE